MHLRSRVQKTVTGCDKYQLKLLNKVCDSSAVRL